MERSKIEEVALKIVTEEMDLEPDDEIVADVADILENFEDKEKVAEGDEESISEFVDLVEGLMEEEDGDNDDYDFDGEEDENVKEFFDNADEDF